MRPFESTIRKIIYIDNGKLTLDKNLRKQAETESLTKIAVENPKLHIWLGGYSLLVEIVNSFYYSDYLQSKKAEELFDDNRKIFN